MNRHDLVMKRKAEIEQGLFSLLQEAPFDKITVADLAGYVDISRKCFYHYFPSKEACLEGLTDQVILDAARYVLTAITPDTPETDLYRYNLEYWKGQRPFLEMIARNNLDTFFFHRCMTHYLSEERSKVTKIMHTEQQPFDEDILYFCVSGQVSLMMRWCRRGFDTPVEEMARKFNRLFQSPLVQLDV